MPLMVAFAGGETGSWRVDRCSPVVGPSLPRAARLEMLEGAAAATPPSDAVWVLRGSTSNDRYLTAEERDALTSMQQALGRPEATCAALIPVTKSDAWWALAQDERQTIFEQTSRHVATGMDYLPAVARRLHHGRDLGAEFDFLTWFEYAPQHAAAFEDLVDRLRASEEWTFVEREVDIRVSR